MSARRAGSGAPDPFALARQMLAAQQAQLDVAAKLVEQGRVAAKWQADALAVAGQFAQAQRSWLKLWGL
jgi:hypothetical protein